jgi:hypothetical protein
VKSARVRGSSAAGARPGSGRRTCPPVRRQSAFLRRSPVPGCAGRRGGCQRSCRCAGAATPSARAGSARGQGCSRPFTKSPATPPTRSVARAGKEGVGEVVHGGMLAVKGGLKSSPRRGFGRRLKPGGRAAGAGRAWSLMFARVTAFAYDCCHGQQMRGSESWQF